MRGLETRLGLAWLGFLISWNVLAFFIHPLHSKYIRYERATVTAVLARVLADTEAVISRWLLRMHESLGVVGTWIFSHTAAFVPRLLFMGFFRSEKRTGQIPIDIQSWMRVELCAAGRLSSCHNRRE